MRFTLLLATLAIVCGLPALACQSPPNAAALKSELAQGWNAQRRAAGLPALRISPTLSQVAQQQSCVNAARNTILHTGADGARLGPRLKRAGYRFRAANENVGKFRAPGGAVNWWMNSAGHRANILSSKVRELGVGLARGSDGGLHWTGISGRAR
ncbi:MAG: CAP domain-containing protein [Rhodobacteraceae bacterium]|nr:CAP domain-containing protein [Paracoccaceae bacterium]